MKINSKELPIKSKYWCAQGRPVLSCSWLHQGSRSVAAIIERCGRRASPSYPSASSSSSSYGCSKRMLSMRARMMSMDSASHNNNIRRRRLRSGCKMNTTGIKPCHSSRRRRHPRSMLTTTGQSSGSGSCRRWRPTRGRASTSSGRSYTRSTTWTSRCWRTPSTSWTIRSTTIRPTRPSRCEAWRRSTTTAASLSSVRRGRARPRRSWPRPGTSLCSHSWV